MSDMTLFDVRVKTSSGFDTVKVHAERKEDVEGLVPVSGRILSIVPSRREWIGKSLSREDRIIFLGRLSLMTSSGVSVGRSLDIISRRFSGRIAKVAHDIKSRIQDGSDVVQALRAMPEHFPPSTVSLIESGVHGGNFAKALKDASGFEKEMLEVGKASKKGFMGSIFEFLLSSSLIIGVAYFLAPWMMNSPVMAIAEGKVDIDWALLMADILAFFISFVLGVSGSLLMITHVFKPAFPGFADSVTLKIPVFRDLVLSKTYYSSFYGLSMLVASGVRLKDAFSLTANSTPEGAIKEDFRRAISAIEDGRPWAFEMMHLDETDQACLETSQDRKEIANAFLQVANAHKERYGERMTLTVGILDTVSSILMALAGFLIFIITALPGMQIANAI